MKKILLFTIGVAFSLNFYCQNFGNEMGKLAGVSDHYNSSGYFSNTYNYFNEVNAEMEWPCVENVNRYYLQNYVLNFRISGQNTANYYNYAAQWGLSVHPNGGDVSPQMRDVLCLSGGCHPDA